MNCPPKLRNLRAHNINPSYLYSYWITTYFLIYACLYLVLKYYRISTYLPKWFNPYPTVIIGTVAQLVIFTLGAGTIPGYFVTGVAMWKLCLLAAALILLPADWSLPTFLFNILAIGVYLGYLIWWLDINPIELYMCIASNPAYYPPTLRDFLSIRFGLN